MQTEEVVPRAQSTGLDGSLSSERLTPLQPLSFSSPHYPSMAVKQEPQEQEDERGRQAPTFSPQTEIDDVQSAPEASPKRTAEQPSLAIGSLNVQTPQQNGCKKPTSRGRRKSRWKLKFHHQALPPEYLDHYEATLAQEAALNSTISHGSEAQVTCQASPAPMQTFTQTPPPIADVQGWLQRLAAMQNEIYSGPSASRRSVITSTQSPQQQLNYFAPLQQQQQQQQQHQHQHQHQQQHQRNSTQQQQPQPRPPMKYSDLPYMGEITLDNSKPRRGRKPKKADICHLIYKNYGTILPGTPGLEEKQPKQPKLEQVPQPIPFQRSDIQNRISSLLEKRLTQERRTMDLEGTREQEEPLNLCIRDLNLLKIRLNEKHSSGFGSYHSKSEGSSDAEDMDFGVVPTHEAEHQGSNSDLSNDLKAIEVENQMTFNNNQQTACNGEIGETNGSGNDLVNNNVDASKRNPEFLYWPNAGVFIHPVALQSQFLYYQKLAQGKDLVSPEQISKEQRIVPKSIYSMLENKKPSVSVPTSIPPPEPTSPVLDIPLSSTPSPRPKRNSGNQSQSCNQPMKRKRSAIFIPPMPTENNTNPATEVSICKFKFTGGAKPSLQEKKSLSVDSGGNFRYYSGTGDKSMRGYEFFPREALQQPANQPGGSTSAFLNAAAERQPQPMTARPVISPVQDDSRKRRKSRKSIQREKLEQTFKEKGFLIQTQQLESAEGATYCKFRQLRKFTRYLFRSWKDYLPGNVRELNDSGEPVIKDAEHDPDGSLSVSPGSIELQPTSPPAAAPANLA